MISSQTLNRAKALAAAVIWGASFVATKVALREVHPVTIIVLRFGLGILVLALALARTRGFYRVGAHDLLVLALLGAVSIAIHQGLQVSGLELTSAGSMAWLVSLNPIFTAILAWLFLSESFGPLKVLGLAIALAGAIIVVSKGILTPDVLHLPGTTGDLLALASALNWAIFSVASKPLLKRLPPALMMAYVMTLGWLIVLPFSGTSWSELPALTPAGWLAIAFLGVLCSGLAYLFWYDALAQIEALQVAAFLYVEPLVTVAVAAIVLGEPFTPASLLGGLTILVGVYLVNRPRESTAAKGVTLASD